MKHTTPPTTGTRAATPARRVVIIRAAAGACAVLAAPLLAQTSPSRVDEADDTARTLGYRHDTTQVDAQRFPKHAATQRCANCGFFQGSASDAWAGCAFFGRKQIAAAGWCSAWAAKPA